MTDKLPAPHADHAFLVDLGTGRAAACEAAFHECRIAGVELTAPPIGAAELPASPVPAVDRPPNEAITVRLERGVVDADQLSGWLGADRSQVRTVRVAMRGTDRRTILASWVLDSARIIRFVSRPIAAGGSCLEVEELTLACAGVDPSGG